MEQLRLHDSAQTGRASLVTETLPHVYSKIMTVNKRFIIVLSQNQTRKDNLMKRYLCMFGSNLMALALIGVLSMTALAGPRPFHLVEHGQISATPRAATGT